MIFFLLLSINISPLMNRANKLYEKGEYEKAYELYKKASILAPDNKRIKFNLSDCAYKLNRFREAADGFIRLSQAKDEDLREKSLYNLGNTFMEAKQFKDAINAYKKALILKPCDERAKRNLEIAKIMLKEQDKDKNKDDKDKEDKEEQEKEQQQQQPQQNKINRALQSEQKETMKKALKKQAGGKKKKVGRW